MFDMLRQLSEPRIETIGQDREIVVITIKGHWCPMQTKKSQLEGTRIMPETKFTKFPALSVDLRVGISRSASETDDYFLAYY